MTETDAGEDQGQATAGPTRQLIVSTFLTLDGVMQAPGMPEEDTEGGFEHGGWQMPYVDEELGARIAEGTASTGGLLLGRKTYGIFAAFWPTANDDFAQVMNGMTKWVVSRTLDKVEWRNSTLLKGDAAEEVRKLKAQPGKDIRLIGSGDLAQTLMQNDLVDEYQLMVHPVVLGSGKRLFRDPGAMSRLELVASEMTPKGVFIVSYRRAGQR